MNSLLVAGASDHLMAGCFAHHTQIIMRNYEIEQQDVQGGFSAKSRVSGCFQHRDKPAVRRWLVDSAVIAPALKQPVINMQVNYLIEIFQFGTILDWLKVAAAQKQ